MRMMLKIKIPPEAGNRAVADGSMVKAFESLKAKLKPEAIYFSMEDGMRCVFVFYNIDEEYRFLDIHEPLFSSMGGSRVRRPSLNMGGHGQGLESTRGE